MAMSVLQANRDGSEGLSMLHTWQAVKLINSCFRGRIVKGNGNILALSNAVLHLYNVIKRVTPKTSKDKDGAGTDDSHNVYSQLEPLPFHVSHNNTGRLVQQILKTETFDYRFLIGRRRLGPHRFSGWKPQGSTDGKQSSSERGPTS